MEKRTRNEIEETYDFDENEWQEAFDIARQHLYDYLNGGIDGGIGDPISAIEISMGRKFNKNFNADYDDNQRMIQV